VLCELMVCSGMVSDSDFDADSDYASFALLSAL
jgi:hypothetical protein